jgi:outer membrane murein-binding lipoprotein Lpp
VLRWIAVGVLAAVVLAGCGDPDQKLRDNAAQTARTAASEVNTTRLVVEQLRAHRLWAQSARRMVDDAEKNLGKTADSFSTQQPSTEQSSRLYEQVNSTLDDAVSAVTAVRIALGNNDLAAAERQLPALRLSGKDLDQVGELAK